MHAMKEVVNSMQGPLDATRGAPGLTNKKLLVAFGRYSVEAIASPLEAITTIGTRSY